MQEQATLPVGKVIQKQYLVEYFLGRSNFGATYLVRDQHARDASNSLFVLKEVLEANKQARHRLVSEGKLLRRLHHPGLPCVRQVLNDDKNNRVYWLVDYIAGQDLETLRQQQLENLFSWAEVMHILAPILAAVTYLHQQRSPIIHGDIKPANIVMPREDSGVVLVDFGMIKAPDPGSTTATDRYCYRAPEQFNGSIDVRTDIYALGATFYTLVTGKLPPDARSRLTQVGNEATDPLKPVNSVVPTIPMHIGKAIERALSLDAQHRFSSVEQFWEALWLVLADHPAPVFDKPSVPQGSTAVPTRGPEQAVGQTIEKPVPEPLPVVPAGVEEQEDLDVEKPPVVPKLDSVEDQEDQDTEKLPVVHVAASIEEQEELEDEKPLSVGPIPESTVERNHLNIEQSPPVVPASVEEQEDLDVVPLPEGIDEQIDPDAEKPSLVVPVPHSVEEQEAKTIHLASLPQIYLKRRLSYQPLKINNHSGQSQGSSPSLQDGEAPTQPISFPQEEIGSERRTEKSVTLPEDSSPMEPPELTVTDVNSMAQFTQPSLSDQNGRIDHGSLWPGMDIEMSFSQSDWEWSVSSRQERDGQEE